MLGEVLGTLRGRRCVNAYVRDAGPGAGLVVCEALISTSNSSGFTDPRSHPWGLKLGSLCLQSTRSYPLNYILLRVTRTQVCVLLKCVTLSYHRNSFCEFALQNKKVCKWMVGVWWRTPLVQHSGGRSRRISVSSRPAWPAK